MIDSERIYFYQPKGGPAIRCVENSRCAQRYRCGVDAGEWEIGSSSGDVRWEIPGSAESAAPERAWLMQPGEDPAAVPLLRPAGARSVADGEWLLIPADRRAESAIETWFANLGGLAPDLRLLLGQVLRRPLPPAAPPPEPGVRRGARKAVVAVAAVAVVVAGAFLVHFPAQRRAEKALMDLRAAAVHSSDAALKSLGQGPPGWMVLELARLQGQSAEAQDAEAWAYCSSNWMAICGGGQAQRAEATYRKWEEWIHKRR